MITAIRWFLFVPMALVSAIIVAQVGHWFGNYGLWFIEGNNFWGWTISGLYSALTLVGVGMKVAPKVDKVSKWILMFIVIFWGIISLVGGVVSREDDSLFMFGLMFIFVGWTCFKSKPEKMNFFKG